MLYSLALVPVTLLPGFMGFAGALYTGATAVLGLGFLWLAFGLWRTRAGAAQEKAAMRLFGYSIVYLFLIFSLLLVEKMTGLGALPASALLPAM